MSTPLPPDAPPASTISRKNRSRIAVQVVGFLIGLGLFAWCASVALSPRNREQLKLLGDARAVDVALLIALSAASLVVNATIFWAMIRPVRRVPFHHVLQINTIATALAYLPFKLSLVFRALAHNRRDQLPVISILSWLGNIAIMLLCVVGPLVGASLWRHTVDAMWWIAAIGGIAVCSTSVIVGARLLRHPVAWGLFERIMVGAPAAHPGPIRRAIRKSNLVSLGHEGAGMLASPPAVAAVAILRVVDISLQASRFLIAARMTHQDLPVDQAIIASSAYFVIGVISPAGMLGPREAGVFSILRSDAFAVVILAVSAVEMAVNLTAAGISGLTLRKLRPPKPEL